MKEDSCTMPLGKAIKKIFTPDILNQTQKIVKNQIELLNSQAHSIINNANSENMSDDDLNSLICSDDADIESNFRQSIVGKINKFD